MLADEDGSYAWVSPADYRVAEVRLLDDAGTVGDVGPKTKRAPDNLLIKGDALNALTSLAELPEFASEYVGKVKLAYIDPPFNTQQSFLHYDDALEHSVWLTMMRDRLVQIKKLLARDGSIWVHLDDSEVGYCRVMMDEIFGRDCFVSTVIWEKADSPRMDAQNFSGRHDYILVFGRTDEFRVNRIGRGETPEHYNKLDEHGQRYYLKPLRAMAGADSTREARPTMWFSLTAPDGTDVWPQLPDGGDGRWRWGPERVEREKDRIEWIQTEPGWSPYYRIYDEGRGRPPETIWSHSQVGSNRTSKREIKDLFPSLTPFDTPKPEALLARVIEIGSQPGDVVLDAFLGSGTTAAVAHKMDRRWVGIERSAGTLDRYAIPRLTAVTEGADPGGVSGVAEWRGGGGFRLLDVAPTMFEADEGTVFIADWASNGKLSEATAAQLGFTFEPDAPFAGRKGRSRLAVIDGLVNADVAKMLVDALPEGELLTLCGTAVDPDARAALRELRRGSTVRRIPASILADYRSARWEPSVNGRG